MLRENFEDWPCMLNILVFWNPQEVVNMQPPGELIKRGIDELPCLGDGRQSG